VRVAGDLRFHMIGPGGSHTCAVSTDGVGYCWGGNWHGQLGAGRHDGDPPEHLRLRAPTPIRTELRFSALAAGGISSCGIALDGKAYCWGSPQEGRLGTVAADAANKFLDKMVPTAVGDVVFATVTPRSWWAFGRGRKEHVIVQPFVVRRTATCWHTGALLASAYSVLLGCKSWTIATNRVTERGIWWPQRWPQRIRLESALAESPLDSTAFLTL
jgi:hypothetical protein